jgi:hypothetical protein
MRKSPHGWNAGSSPRTEPEISRSEPNLSDEWDFYFARLNDGGVHFVDLGIRDDAGRRDCGCCGSACCWLSPMDFAYQ